jgi:hypothetical protein
MSKFKIRAIANTEKGMKAFEFIENEESFSHGIYSPNNLEDLIDVSRIAVACHYVEGQIIDLEIVVQETLVESFWDEVKGYSYRVTDKPQRTVKHWDSLDNERLFDELRKDCP